MTDVIETPEAPNWLKELEAKRERRLKAKLGHEAGAGAPCLTCEQKCPGLDLHFWRKICKNCKCAKENHDVPDDDIYGWAQFQLLGSKPTKARKFVLPGRKEVELEWTPKGQNDTVDKYLKTLPPELLPVKGSQAAQERKQLLQKQIPVHDIDPSLCHELTEEELKQMNEYVSHIKQNSVGIGHVIQLGVKANAQILGSKYHLPNSQMVQLQGPNNASVLGGKSLNKQLQNLSLEERKALNIPEDVQSQFVPGAIRDISYQNVNESTDDMPKQHLKNLPHFAASTLNRFNETRQPQKLGNIRDLAFSTHDPNILGVENSFDTPNHNINNRDGAGLSKFDPNIVNITESIRNPTNINFGTAKFDLTANTAVPNKNEKTVNKFNLNSLNGKETVQNPTNLAFGQAEFDANAPNTIEGTPKYNMKSFPTNYVPNKLSISEQLQNPSNITFGHANTPNTIEDTSKYNMKSFPTNYVPNNLSIPEQLQNPSYVPIGSINDIIYPNQQIKTAEQVENNIFEPTLPLKTYPDISANNTLFSCHRCKKTFDSDAIVIGIERSDALFHSDCFKCKGCNQNLADLVYFYDSENDDIYCGRDYAKIRGIPRCKACDELIFVKEYCLAENSTFHVKHFCCFICDMPLADQNYLMEESQPLCIPCYEKVKADRCNACLNIIKPDEQGANLKGTHFHATDECFACKVCKLPLLGSKLLFRNQKLYCSANCFGADN